LPDPVRQPAIRLIEATDDLSSIRVSDPESVELKRFLVQDAWSFQTRGLGHTYGLFLGQSRELIGYMTLSVCSVQPGRNARIHRSKSAHAEPEFNYDYPGLRIARMLIGDGYRGGKLGQLLLDRATNIALDQFRPVTGCRFLFVDAKPNARAFYERYGFEVINTAHNLQRGSPTMYFDLMPILE
jgi:predicted GNAT family N-acyltransferase